MDNIEIFGYSIPTILVIYFVFRAISNYEEKKAQEKISKMSPKEREEFLKKSGIEENQKLTLGWKIFIGILVLVIIVPPLIVWILFF